MVLMQTIKNKVVEIVVFGLKQRLFTLNAHDTHTKHKGQSNHNIRSEQNELNSEDKTRNEYGE